MSRQAVLLSVLAAIAVVAGWWLFAYSPGQERIAAVEAEIAAAEAEAVSLQGRVGRLEAVRAAAPETEAAIANLRGIVPSDPALASALRQLEAAAEDAGIALSAVGTTRPTPVEAEARLHVMDLTLTAEGSFFQVVDFLRRLEDPTITSRGVVLSNVTMAAGEYPTLSVAVTGQIFAELDPVPDPTVVEPVPVPADPDAPTDPDAPDAVTPTAEPTPAEEVTP